MPQVYIIFGPEAKELAESEGMVSVLQKVLMHVVDDKFGLTVNDTASTAVQALAIVDETDIQVEIRYTAGRDEYNQGKPFDPTPAEQERLCDAIQGTVKGFLKSRHLPNWSLSVWCKPHYNSVFKQYKWS